MEKEEEGSEDASSGEEEANAGPTGSKFYDEEGNFQWKGQESSSSDESGAQSGEEGEAELEETDNEGEGVWGENEGIPFGETVEEGEALGKRLALNKMDWDIVQAVDLLALFSSLCTGDKVVSKVEIFPSLYGIEQMKKDSTFGPPKEIFNPDEEEINKSK